MIRRNAVGLISNTVFTSRLWFFILLISVSVEGVAQWQERIFSGGEVDVVSSTVIYRANYNLFKSFDAGVSWQVLNKANFTNWTAGQSLIFETGPIRIYFIDELNGFYFGSNLIGTHEVIFRTTNGGGSWTLVHSAVGGRIRQIAFTSSSIGFAIGEQGRMLKTSNGGASWSSVSTPVTNSFNELVALDNANFIIATDNEIIKTTNGGTSWTVVPMSDNVLSISFLNASIGVAVTRQQLYYTSNAGLTWLPLGVNIPKDARFSVVKFFSNGFGYMGTDIGLYKSQDGKFWSPQRSLGEVNVHQLDFFENHGYLLATNPSNGLNDYYTSSGGDPLPVNEAHVVEVAKVSTNQCRGVYPVQAKIINQGIHPLTTLTLHFSIDGIEQTPMHWSGNLMSGDTTEFITIGSFHFTKTGHEFAVKVWSGNPNGFADDYAGNDQATILQAFNKFSGSYTVGNSPTSDFANLSTAISFLQNNGICGNDGLVFNVEPGTYVDDFDLDYIYDYSGQKIIIQSTTGNPADVIFQAQTTGYQIRFGEITVKGISWKSESGNVFSVLKNYQSEHIHLELLNNVIETGSVSYKSGIYLTSFTGSIVIKGNSILNGFNGLLYSGSATTPEPGSVLTITGNTFSKQARQIVNIESGQAEMIITANRFIGTPGKAEHFYAIWMDNNARPVRIANNYFEIISTAEMYALNSVVLYHVKDIDFAFNTTLATNTSPITLLSVSHSEDIRILNNIFANYGKGSIYSLTDNARVTCDYNSPFSKDGMGATGMVPYAQRARDFSIWQAISGYDMHSISVDPQLDGNGPHIKLNTSNYALSGSGTPLSNFLTDIDGELRSVTKPDIGADEFNTPATDLGIVHIKTDHTYCPSSRTIEVELKNFGKTNINTYRVNWSVNQVVQPFVIGAQPILAGATKIQSVPAYLFGEGDFEIKVWLSHVGGDPIVWNDSSAVTINVRQGLEGTYTVGGVNPNFSSLLDATAALATNGVCGPVVLKIRPGVYEEQVSLGKYPGVSATNTVSIQSETKDSTSVVFKAPTSTVNFEAAAWIELRSISIEALYGPAISFRAGSSHITLSNCRVSGSVVDDYLASEEFNTIQHCSFAPYPDGSLPGITLYGHYSDILERNNSIVKNSFPQGGTITMTRQFSCRVNENVNPRIVYHQVLGEYQIIGNKTIRMDIQGCHAKGKTQGLISNNIVFGEISQLELSNSDNVRILHNTIVSSFDIGFGPVLIINSMQENGQDFDQIEVKNNIIVSLKNNMVASYNTTNGIDVDYNTYWTNHKTPLKTTDGTVLDFAPHANYFEELDKYQLETTIDTHSQFLLPRFVSSTDFHIANDARLKSKGTAVGILTDFDGDVRNTTSPDPGADEFTFLAASHDAGITLIKRPHDCGTSQKVYATIRNFGSTTLTSVQVKWFLSGNPLNTYNWTGTLLRDQSSEIELGTVVLTPADTFRITAWTENPNGVLDNEHLNDSTSLGSIYQKLTGNYSVGPGNELDFPSPRQAATYLNNVGVCGPVTMLIEPGIYDERVWIRTIEGASEVNRITFQSKEMDSTSVLIRQNDWAYDPQESVNNYTVLLDGAQFVSLRGLCIQGDYLVNSVVYQNGVSNTTLSNMWIRGAGSRVYYDGSLLIMELGSSQLRNNVIENSFFENGFNGIWVKGTGDAYHYYSMHNTTIRNNRFAEQSGLSIGIVNAENTVIEKNDLRTSTQERYFYSYGINVSSGKGGLKISNNRVQGNYGAAIKVGFSSTPGGLVFNNVVLPSPGYYGISSEANKKLTFAFNTVVTRDVGCFMADYDSGVSVLNNNFIHYGAGKYADYDEDFNDVYHNTHDYNNYFGSGELSPGAEVHPRYIDPQFVSSTDLHPQNLLFRGTGKSIPGIDKDFDGNVRGEFPTIGAYEVKVYPGDIQINDLHAQSCHEIFMVLQNAGQDRVGSALVNWSINGEVQTPYEWKGLLLPGEISTPFKLGTIPSAFAGDLNIKAWSELPNGFPDTEQSNDEKEMIFSPIPSVELGSDFTSCLIFGTTITLEVSQLYEEYQWSTGSTQSSTEVSTSGTYSLTVKDVNGCFSSDQITVQTIPVTIPTITLEDGILISSEADNYQWILDGAPIENEISRILTLAAIGDYQVMVTTNGCQVVSDVKRIIITEIESSQDSIRVYPNPTSRFLHVILPHYFTGQVKMMFRNAIGQEYAPRVVVSEAGVIMDLEDMNAGIYFLEIISSTKSRQLFKIVVQ
ncbi:MAG: right-handed parallel beta-helix repeat-containing protein [Cyclobacteriaceae bacterium]|nr:right-handed parallel beta-helix repeat-containing protein [Cyclobacteriaceae bacterium]